MFAAYAQGSGFMVGIVSSRYSYKMIKESGGFVVNIVEKEYKNVFDYLGSHSKRDGDKLGDMNVKLTEGTKVNAPLLRKNRFRDEVGRRASEI